MASRPETARQQPDETMLPVMLVLSLALHTLAAGLLPGFSQDKNNLADPLIVELQPPQPKKPLPPPEPPKPEPPKPEPPKPKEPTKRLPPPPKPLPVIQPTDTPPPAPVAESPLPSPSVMTAAAKPSEAPPTAPIPIPPPPLQQPPKPAPVPVDLDTMRSNYGSVLSREFAKHKQYPRIAQLRGWQGTVRLELKIDASGTVTSSTVAESSGFEILDKQALEMVRKASPLPQPPEALRGQEFTLIVPVSFKLE